MNLRPDTLLPVSVTVLRRFGQPTSGSALSFPTAVTELARRNPRGHHERMRGSQLSDRGAVRFYRDTVVIEAMVSLVERLSAKDYASMPYSTSHHWLCIGSPEAHVAVTHFSQGYYEVHYNTRRRQKSVVFRSPNISEVESRIDSLIQRGLLTHEIESPQTPAT